MVKLKGKTLEKPTQDNRDHMVNKLELGTTVTRSSSQQKYKSLHHKKQEKMKNDLKHIKCFKCSDMGHYAFMCSAQVESKTRLSGRQRRQLRTITYFGCKKEGHKIQACPNFQGELCGSDRSSSGLAPQEKMRTSSNGLLHQEQDKVFRKQVKSKKRSTCPR
jgi:hypothetical protein